MEYRFYIAERPLLVETYVLRGLILTAIMGIVLFSAGKPWLPATLSITSLLAVFFLMEPLQLRLKEQRWFITLVIGLLFFVISFHWFYTASLLAIGFLAPRFNREPVILMNPTGIILHRLIGKQTIHWSELQWVVLKDGVLSIDFRNNRVMQLELIKNHALISEESFNAWAELQVEAAN